MKLKPFKLILNIITIVGLILLIILARNQIIDVFKRLADLNYFWLILIIPLQIINFFSAGKYYQTYLKAMGENVTAKNMFSVALEINFVNLVLPSGGVSGFGYLNMRLKQFGVSSSKSTLLQVSRHSLTFLSFIIYLLFAMFMLVIFGSVNRIMIAISMAIIMLVIVAVTLALYLISSSSRIKKFVSALPNVINWAFNKFKRIKKPTIDIEKLEKSLDDFHDDYVQIMQDRKNLKEPFKWTMLMNLTELSTIFVVYLAFGSLVNPGAIIIAYAFASLAGLVAVFPGGVGVYEGLMTAIMASAGIPNALALSATLVYRVCTMVIFIPIGFILYQIALRKNNESDNNLATE